MSNLLSKPPYEMTDDEVEVAKKLSAREQYANYCDEHRQMLTIVPTYTDWLEGALWTSQKDHEAYSAEWTQLLNDLWGLVYPGQTDWEYPGMVYRHVKARIEELRAALPTGSTQGGGR